MVMKKLLKLTGLALILGALLIGCGESKNATADEPKPGDSKPGTAQKGSLTVDGSSTVFPIVNAMGEDFKKANPGVKVTINKSGTGSGMQKFGRGEIDVATASRPIEQKEVDALAKANIDFIEIPVAYDGVCVVVNPKNTFITSLTPDDLKKAWSDGSTVKTWADMKSGWPAKEIKFYGPTNNHGTYEYFTEAINKKKGNIRNDYQANQEYNVIVQSIAGDENGIGYVGFNYYAENKDKLKVVSIDAGKGPVAPSEESVTNGTYTPLSRPLFIYVSKKAMDRPEVKAFVDFALGESGMAAVKESNMVQLPKEALDAVKKHVSEGKLGSAFMGVAPGMTIQQVLAKETAGSK